MSTLASASRLGALPGSRPTGLGRFTASTLTVNASHFAGHSVQQRHASTVADTTQVPDFSHYQASGDPTRRAFTYLVAGTTGFTGAVLAKNMVVDFLASLSASADVLALAKVEVDLTSIPEGKNLIIKWRGKPVFIRHRTDEEIQAANGVDIKELRDPQTDSVRVTKPEWLVVMGVCTHLGCVPLGDSGEYGGWFCPCHGSHYDTSGRIRKGPAPLNLEVPAYEFIEDGAKVVIG